MIASIDDALRILDSLEPRRFFLGHELRYGPVAADVAPDLWRVLDSADGCRVIGEGTTLDQAIVEAVATRSTVAA